MSFWFTIREGFKGFKRARLATTITITSLAFALLLIGLFILFTLNINQWIGDFRAQIELEVFLEAHLDEEQSNAIKEKISGIEGINSVNLITKQEAAERFQKEFGRSIYDVLESNPLPPSCTIRLQAGYQTASAANKISLKIAAIAGVDEVVYKRDLLNIIDYYIELVYLVIGAIGLILIIIAVILLNNTIRLTILARKDIIDIMKLVGATEAFIRRPFFVEGFIQGLLGGVAASLLLYLSVSLIKEIVYEGIVSRPEIYGIIIITGVLIGIISSTLSVSKYLQRL